MNAALLKFRLAVNALLTDYRQSNNPDVAIIERTEAALRETLLSPLFEELRGCRRLLAADRYCGDRLPEGRSLYCAECRQSRGAGDADELLEELFEELDQRYDGAPDSGYQWMVDYLERLRRFGCRKHEKSTT